MKINFGKFKRRNIIIGKNEKMRPTQSMAKSIIFNLIEINSETKVMDLFAGTGLLGFESMSLGAKAVTWSDNNIHSVKAIQKNIDNFELDKNNFKVFKVDFRIALKNNSFKPNLIFLDPPFISEKYYDEALEFIYNKEVLEDDGIIVIEKPRRTKISSLDKFIIKNSRTLGEKDILIISKK